ncbi:MAG: nicotinate-nucleotide adenylyltransferase [Spartobacteria bacterium]
MPGVEMNPRQKIGLFGGSFDPIHHGHLILARDAMEQLGLAKVIFIPANISPHKLDHPPAPAAARCEMVAAAIAGEPRFEMDTCEVEREGVSFAVDTVRRMIERHPATDFFYFIGEDNLAALHTWKEIEELRRLAPFVVLARGGTPTETEFPVVTRHIDISSTDIRKRIAAGLPVRYLLPDTTCEIIQRLGLYRNERL